MSMTEYLATLGAVAGVVAAMVASLSKWTTVSPRAVAIFTLVFGPSVAVLFHLSGFLDLGSVKSEPKATILAAAWGLVASLAGQGVTRASGALDAFKGGK